MKLVLADFGMAELTLAWMPCVTVYLPTPGWSLTIVADLALGMVYLGPF
jgi:hypothetical protein